jgi:endoglucanase
MRRLTCSARGGRGLLCSIVLAAASLVPASRAAAAGAGYWHTSGNQILDANDQVVRITGINWYGFETTDKVIHGMWAQDWHNIVNLIKANGYTVVRMPFSDDFVSNPINPTNIGASNGSGPMNRDVIGLDSQTIMDKVIQQLGDVGIRVILDNHRSAAGNSADESGLWYTAAYSEQTMINNWVTLVKRYQGYKDPQGNPIVIGVDLRNEPHLNVSGGSATGACWTGDSATSGCPSTSNKNWPKAAERIGNAILAANPNLLVIVEGAECYNGDCDWWGGNLMGVASNPVMLSVANRIVYSAHDYGPALFQQKWFNANTTCASLATVWDHYFGYISAQGIAPVLIGEFGANNGAYTGTTPASQGQWFQCLTGYIKARPSIQWTYWALNGEDDYGLVDAQYNPTLPAPGKQAILAAMQSPLDGGGGISCSTPNIPQNFTANTVSAGQVDLKWNAVPSPGTGCAVTYDVFRSTNGTTMVASDATRVGKGITGTSWSDTTVAASTQYYYLVEAVDVTVASPPSSKASATTPQGSGSTFALTVALTGSGIVTSSTGGINCGTTCSATYPAGTVVTLTAAAMTNAAFGGWNGPCTGAAPTCVVTMNAAQTVGATFGGTTFALTVTTTGTGTVTSSAGGINCGATCSASYATGTVVTLTATPGSPSTFAGWSGACTGAASTCVVTMSSAQSVGATFACAAPAVTLTVTKTGTGTGTVSSSPSGISCGSTCSMSISSCGVLPVVTLTATPAAGSTFTGWSGGGCTGTAATCSVSLGSAATVTASFTATPGFALTVTKAGVGSGTVTSSVGGINCGTTCSATIASGTVVTLTAAPTGGSTWGGWSGACTGSATTCTVTMTANQSVTATFTAGTTPCANPITFTSNTGNFNTTAAACYRTSQTVNGWGCSNFTGRTISVNGGTAIATCGAGPFPLAKSSDGYTYFSATAGQYPWASIYLW